MNLSTINYLPTACALPVRILLAAMQVAVRTPYSAAPIPILLRFNLTLAAPFASHLPNHPHNPSAIRLPCQAFDNE
ncbi:hypothetical protein TRIATDRAFT_296995 [Trichoderma atroviride IMI 206040]|uniref:Uncharacterized protein n=1 Tax=Hypocrea atroviridis (strain ATCC 20476 / IMI 206040) TaxID=452589 RepID=G9NF88_HYPAI|nr:uncharacterized protein TRIATDRAFT_296995 [Trichoderma atroviride IMI 206040]EHK50604.1 hypothetical protein TRIATDRAFT_296995 [Trichoderma atroviride IMI 206040]